jgi:adenylylsulfate kinase
MKKNGQNAFVIWFTGLSGSGKTTLAKSLFIFLKTHDCKVELLDGDKIRSLLNSREFSESSRIEHIKRMGFLASILEKNNIITIASFISPHRKTRNSIRKLCKNFIEVYLDPGLSVCEKRDVKGLYEKVRAGKIKDFTGIGAGYEKPLNPEIVIDTGKLNIKKSLALIIKFLKENNLIC